MREFQNWRTVNERARNNLDFDVYQAYIRICIRNLWI